MNRLLSRRDGEKGAHRRDKSRDKSSEKKVKSLDGLSNTRPSLILPMKHFRSQSVTSLCAAFSNPPGKSTPLLRISYSVIQATSANSRPGFFLQARPLSGEGSGIMSLFKPDNQKKSDKEQIDKVGSPPVLAEIACTDNAPGTSDQRANAEPWIRYGR